MPPQGLVARLRACGSVFAEEEAQLLVEAASTPGELADLVDRRVAGVPLEHVLGWVAFCGRRFAVGPGVFVPRARTELLVRCAVAVAGPGAVVVDLCCGSGAVGAAVVHEIGAVDLHAVDVDPLAVRCARRNVEAVGGTVYEGDLYAPLPAALRGRVDVVVANAPYVPTDAIALMPPEARLHEPVMALDGGADGLGVLRRVVRGAPVWLAPGGYLLAETSDRQVPAALDLLAGAGLEPRPVQAEERARVVVGRRPVTRFQPGG